MNIIGCTSSVIIVLLALMAVSKARIKVDPRINQRTKLWMCGQGKRIVTLNPGDNINIYGPNFLKKHHTKQKCNIILQTSNVNSTINIRCRSFGERNQIKQNKCRHYLQINAVKYCVKETPTVHAKYGRAKLKFVTRRQFYSSGFSCSAEVPKLNGSNSEEITKIDVQKCRCGKVKYNTRIVNGVETRVRSHPWMVAIVNSLLQIPFCGGTLINDRWVMTAGHCFSWFDRMFPGFKQKVLLLEHRVGLPDGEMMHNIKRIISHPKYNELEDGNDVALIELWKPVNFKLSDARPVCLPPPGSRYGQVNATVLGWGMSMWNGPISNVLNEVEIPTIPNEKCNKIYSGFRIKENMICAGYENLGTGGCLGDSGGPLLTQEDEHYTQIGVLSFATDSTWARPGCNAATGYTRVTSVLDWIKQTSKSGVTCQS